MRLRLFLYFVLAAIITFSSCKSAEKKETPPPPEPQNYSDLMIHIDSLEDNLSNIKFRYMNENKEVVELGNGARVPVFDGKKAIIYLDLSATSDPNHIRFMTNLRKGMKAYIVITEEGTNRVLVRQPIGHTGYRRMQLVTFLDDQRREIVTQQRSDAPLEPVRYNDKSVVPIRAELADGMPKDTVNGYLHIEMDYSRFREAGNKNLINGNELVSELAADPSKVVKKDVQFEVMYSEKYKDSPRKSEPVRIVLIKKPWRR